MSDWNDRPPALAALIERARDDVPPPERLDAVRARLERELGGPSSPPPLPPLGRVAGLALAGAAALAALMAWLMPAPPRSPVVVPSPPSPAPIVAPEPAAEPEVPEAAAEPEAPPAPPPSRPPRVEVAAGEGEDGLEGESESDRESESEGDRESESESEGSTLRAEILLLDRAIAARERGEVARARAILAEHAARFPSGVLTPERERLRAELGEGADDALSGDPAP